MKKFISVMLVAAMAVTALTGCGSNSGSSSKKDADKYYIGGIGPTTGATAIYGTAVKNGAQIAVDEINAAGGINGKQIEYRFEDDQNDAEKAVNAYNTLKDWGMQMLVGTKMCIRDSFNVPLKDGKITDENRLVAALPTIKKLIADGGKVILCSHLGKVKTEEDYTTKTLAPVAARLSELLGQEVKFAADREVVGPNAKAAVEAMKDGDCLLYTSRCV